MHSHLPEKIYKYNEIKSIHPLLLQWMTKEFPEMETASLQARVSQCEDGNCPVSNTVLFFKLAANQAQQQLHVGRVLEKISRMDFSLAVKKQFPQR